MPPGGIAGRLQRLPVFYGWVVVAVAFVTMSIGVNVRTAFSLLYPPLLTEFGWERGVTAAAFSLGFLAATMITPVVGLMMDRVGPRLVIAAGALMCSTGLISATVMTEPWHLYLSMGVLVVGGSTAMAYLVHSVFLPNWFAAQRALAIGIAFSGVGIGSIVLFPLLQMVIDSYGWRAACWLLVAMLIFIVLPLNLALQRQKPADIGEHPDGVDPNKRDERTGRSHIIDNVVDKEWVAINWTLARAMRTREFWLVFVGFTASLFAWYTILVHQTQYIIDQGYSVSTAALALGVVPLLGVGAQIGFGYLSDQIGREWGHTIGCLGFVICYGALLRMQADPHVGWLMVMIAAQGLLGYSMTPNFGAIPAELFQGPHFGAIYGVINVGSTLGAALGPWLIGWLHDLQGNYQSGFWIAGSATVFSCVCIWLAAPRKVRLVAGQARRRQRQLAVA